MPTPAQRSLRKYELIQKLGHGAFAVVWKATSKATRHTVAIKKLHAAYRKPAEARMAYREILYLSELRGHDNIVWLQDVIESMDGRDLYLVLEYLQTDLFNVLQAKVLEERHKPFVLYQLLRALLFLHSAQLVHRDVKASRAYPSRSSRSANSNRAQPRFAPARPSHFNPV